MTRIAIIGAGIAGLTCARRLTEAGLSPVVFDKGRGIGGRVATRRIGDGGQFDHGARHLSASDPAFQSVLEGALAAGAIAPWQVPGGPDVFVGTPGMTAFAKYLGAGADIRQNTELRAVTRTGAFWSLEAEEHLGDFDLLVCTAPTPQTSQLVGRFLDPGALARVRYDACLTLMAVLAKRPGLPDAVADPGDGIAWIAREASKPGRGPAECWTVQATPVFSTDHLESSKDQIAAAMLDRFLPLAGLTPDEVIHAAGHRWRYGLVANPLGAPFLAAEDGTLYAGGDWCLGPCVEHAWASGHAIAEALLQRL